MPDLETVRPEPVGMHADPRGVLWKVLTGGFGELYALTTNKGAVRGNHHHERTTEWFFVVKGRMQCRLARPETGERSEYLLDAVQPAVLRVPPGIAHSLTGLSEEPAILLAYADQAYDETSPDMIPFDFSRAGGNAS